MKLAFSIKKRLRSAILLALMMFCLIILSLFESYNIQKASDSFNSIFEDRLIPAVDLYSISEKINTKQELLFSYLYTDEITLKEIQGAFEENNQELDQLIAKYEKTFLVRAETNYLNRLKNNIQNYRRDEILLIETAARNKQAARELYARESANLYRNLKSNLNLLISVQTTVGSDLISDYRKTKANSEFVTNLQLFIAIVLGVLIFILVITDKQVHINQEKYNLN